MQSILTGMITVVMRKGELMDDLISRQAAIDASQAESEDEE